MRGRWRSRRRRRPPPPERSSAWSRDRAVQDVIELLLVLQSILAVLKFWNCAMSVPATKALPPGAKDKDPNRFVASTRSHARRAPRTFPGHRVRASGR